jgi:hypothetical protein
MTTAAAATMSLIAIEQIHPNPDQPRRWFDENAGPLFDAWAAGFIDGEGCIYIHRFRVRRYARHYYALVVSVGQSGKHGRMCLERLQESYGGRVYHHGPDRRANRQEKWNWSIRTAAAAEFLARIRPYLIVKADQADVALEFRSLVGGVGVRAGDRYALHEALYWRMRELKNYRGGSVREPESSGAPAQPDS